MGVTRTGWPLGIALRRAREHAGLSVRAAARRTQGAISSGRWYQLESGYQKAGGHNIPVGTTAATVAAAAKAVGWDINDALSVAGFDPLDLPQPKQSPLEAATDEELAAEFLRRMKGARDAVRQTPSSGAPDETGQAQEDELDDAQVLAAARAHLSGKGVRVQDAYKAH